jgi:hypothetical protein
MRPGYDAMDARAARFENRIVWAAYAVGGLSLAFAGWFPVNNSDTFGHLAQGRQIVELGHVPQLDTFSFWQPGQASWHNYEWLSDLAMFRLYEHTGYDGLIAGKCLLLLLTAGLLIGLAQLLSGARGAVLCSLLIVLAIPAVRFRLTERPHLVALPFCALYLIGLSYLMRAWGRASARLDAVIVVSFFMVHLAWVNLHGSHLLGLTLTLVHLVFAVSMPEVREKILWVLGVQLVASSISPFGPAISIDALKHILDPEYRVLVTEWEPWQPTHPLWLWIAPFAQTLALLAAVRSLFSRGPAGRALVASIGVLALSAFRSIRFVAEYLLLSAPVIAIGLGAMLRLVPVRRFAVVAGAFLCGGSVLVPWAASRLPPFAAPGGGMRSSGLPAASGEWLARHALRPRVFAAIEDSWYLMFAVPQAQFLVDGRTPFYGPAHVARIRQAFASPRLMTDLLARYRVNTVVPRYTFKPHRTLVDSMNGRPGWSVVSIEDHYAVYMRDDTEFRVGARPRALALRPSYELGWLRDTDAVAEQAIVASLAELPQHENNRGYRSWVRATLALKPLLREGGNNGIRWLTDPREVGTLKQLGAWLDRAAQGADGVPVVHAYQGLVAAALCELDKADTALSLARFEGESRETLLGAQEIALRRGKKQEVETFLRRASAMPGAADDGWLLALRQGLHTPPRCPGAR